LQWLASCVCKKHFRERSGYVQGTFRERSLFVFSLLRTQLFTF
jgi:hypothetical protein